MKLHGKDGKIVIGGSPLTAKTSWSLSIEREYADVSVYADEGKTFSPGLKAANGSFEGFLDAGSEAAVTAANSDIPVDVQVWASGSVMVASGKAYVDLRTSAAVNDAVRCNGTLKGTGRWVYA